MQIDQQVIQTIIVIIILLAALFFIIYKIVKKIKHPVSGCDGCSAECKGCELTTLKKEISDTKKTDSTKIDSTNK